MIAPALQNEFARLVGRENVFDDASDLLTYSYDAALLPAQSPGLALRPGTLEELGRVVALCNQEGLPLTIRGAGTNLSGGAIPEGKGVVVVTTALNRILEINQADMYAVVQPGVINQRLFDTALAQGLFYPPDPGSQAVSTLGGNVAENSGGLRGLKYGVTRDYVMGLNFFDTEGQLVKTGSRTVKCATGYNLAGLMVGSEGTLGVIGEIILKLIPPPQASRALLAVFDSMEAASQTVAAIIAARIVPATLEFLDNFTIRTVEDFSGAGLPVEAAAMLLIEVDGHPAQVADEAARVEDICRAQGATQVRPAKDAAERDRIWTARRSAIPALARLKPSVVLEDATVPRSQVPALVRFIRDLAAKHELTIGTFGHAGDGNLHPTIVFDQRDEKQFARVREAVEELFDKALELGGTLSGEHGLGLTKTRFLVKEVGPATLAWARRLKKAMDPKGILNPGKIVERD
ncbi:MAG: FAD-binding protein [Desulfarculaceae bacterium]|nr:FAD-binding protein [Desulfarculaceae bacterium]MCF8073962.1 FAD-binding protein [Desulfarculaceae bacterium]MCF8102648.1 FAD-binding protein [Desulfarculaceae bacterium]MCF8116111.1 FAD-binding protein [Desulfarculaceae bacterium]